MSVCFVVLPAAVAASWPILSGLISAACTAAGFRALKAPTKEREVQRESTREESVEFEVSSARVEELGAVAALNLTDGHITATFCQDERGQCKLHVQGNKSQQELIATGRALMQRVRQQLAYHRVMEELKRKGYTVVQEEVAADESIRLRVRSW